MIVISSNGYKVSSKSPNLTPKNPQYKCPNCGCVYENILDIESCLDKELATENQNPPLLCNECGTELVSFDLGNHRDGSFDQLSYKPYVLRAS